MSHSLIIKAGIYNDELNLPKRGFPVSIKNSNGVFRHIHLPFHAKKTHGLQLTAPCAFTLLL